MSELYEKILWYKEQLQKSLTESWYIMCQERCRIKDHHVLIQSNDGQNLPDETVRLIHELEKQNNALHIHVTCIKKPERGTISVSNIDYVKINSLRYWYLLAACKYLVNDTEFPAVFLKRSEQSFLYSGFYRRPLKDIGILDKQNGYKFGNMQRNLFAADIILCYDSFTKDLIIRAFCLKNLYRGRFLIVNDYNDDGLYRNICKVFFSDTVTDNSHTIPSNNKENVFIFVETLLRNGITSSVFNLINTIDLNKRNYFFVFRFPGIEDNKDRLYEIPENVGILSLDNFDKTFSELVSSFLYYRFSIINPLIEDCLDSCYRRNFKKYYGNIKHDYFVQFVGYGREVLHLYKQAENNSVFVHNDMKREIETKQNQHKPTIISSYQNYRHVLGVSSKVTEIAAEIAQKKGNYGVVHNCFDYKNVLQKSEMPLTMEASADYVMAEREKYYEILNDKQLIKFVTVGRFSPEKEHLRLLDAFNMYCRSHDNTYLIIIGGYGAFYETTTEYARGLPCWNKIILVKSLCNPFTVLKRCDLFILSSSYEGVPVVFMEADCLGLPILSTDIDGSREFLNYYNGGLLVEENAEALCKGMLSFDAGEIKPLQIDFSEYNKECARQFEVVFT